MLDFINLLLGEFFSLILLSLLGALSGFFLTLLLLCDESRLILLLVFLGCLEDFLEGLSRILLCHFLQPAFNILPRRVLVDAIAEPVVEGVPLLRDFTLQLLDLTNSFLCFVLVFKLLLGESQLHQLGLDVLQLLAELLHFVDLLQAA